MDTTEGFNHGAPIQIRFNDIDMMGHVNNSIQQSYYDFGRMKYLKDVLHEDINQSAESLIIAHISMDFMEPVFMGEDISIYSRITKIGNKSCHMEQIIINANTKNPKSKCFSVLVGFDYVAHQSILLPERWKEKVAAFEKITREHN